MEPLRAFILSREFEKEIAANVACLKAHEVRAELHFSDEMVASLWFQWEGKKSVGRISLWESGDCDSEVCNSRNGNFFPSQHQRCKTKEEFYGMLVEMIATIAKNEELT